VGRIPRLSKAVCGLVAVRSFRARVARGVLRCAHQSGGGMALSRREFVRRIGAGGAGVAAASHLIGYGREELLAFDFQGQVRTPPPSRPGRPPFALAATRT
jgi:hypothetical protein